MLKKFFISMLGSMAALWLSLFIFVIGITVTIGIIAAKAVTTNVKIGDSILYINLSGSIPERASEMSISELIMSVDSKSDDLESILTSIRVAADDKTIKGIYIDCLGSEMGVASRSEVIEELRRFKEKGKWIYAYADEFNQGDYYIASVADKVFLNPVGMLDVHGLASTVIFFKDLADKLGIDIDIVRVGSFKSAVEPFMRMDMSEPSRLQTSVYLNQIWNDMKNTISFNRGIKPEEVNMWADSMCMVWAPERYVEQKAVTELRYRSEVEDMLRSLVKIKPDDELPLISPSEYMSVMDSNYKGKPNKDHIAVLYAVGDIAVSGSDGISSEDLVPEIYQLAQNDKVKGLVLRVNSPGGSAFASEQIWHALEDFKATGKPFFVSMGDYAASGGYYISCGADKIFCDASTLTGSIGIFGIIPNGERLLKNKIGLGFGTVETNPNATFPSYYQAPTKQQLDAMQGYIERGYETFTSRVAQGRDLPVDSVKAIGGGRVWDGLSAIQLGLVDDIGTLSDVITEMAEHLDMNAKDYVTYPASESALLEALLKGMPKNIEMSIDGVPAKDLAPYIEFAHKIKDMAPLQTRMETVIIK